MTARSEIARDDAMPLHQALSAVTLPLAVLLFFVVTLSAPVAYFALGKRARYAAAREAAREAAEVVSREVAEQSVLWRYDTPRLLRRLWVERRKDGLVAIEAADANGQRIDVGLGNFQSALRKVPIVWASAPIEIDDQVVGSIWVATSLTELRRHTLLLVVPFFLLALGLAWTLYFPPLRALRRAEARINESRLALAELNASLESQVVERSSALASAYDALRAKEMRLRAVSTRALSMQEAERRAVARDLHDTAGQSLTGLRIHLQLLAARANSPEQVQDIARRAITAADASLEDFRRALQQLAPAVLDEAGLADAVVRACDGLAERTGVNVKCNVVIEGNHLPRSVQVACYRIVQEALTDVARHSGAKNVTVDLAACDESVTVTVTDDGVGFDATHRSAGFGLGGMRERVDLLDGMFAVESTEGKGTTILVHLPRVLRPSSPLDLSLEDGGVASVPPAPRNDNASG